jgi:hypothetical protein
MHIYIYVHQSLEISVHLYCHLETVHPLAPEGGTRELPEVKTFLSLFRTNLIRIYSIMLVKQR